MIVHRKVFVLEINYKKLILSMSAETYKSFHKEGFNIFSTNSNKTISKSLSERKYIGRSYGTDIWEKKRRTIVSIAYMIRNIIYLSSLLIIWSTLLVATPLSISPSFSFSFSLSLFYFSLSNSFPLFSLPFRSFFFLLFFYLSICFWVYLKLEFLSH